jgi:hypothetical protein
MLLGMRHATDADHVVAVSTFVARERAFRPAARIGAAWGVGHTMTIFLVGGAIAVFKWSISARVGLSMEFAVAVMLVVLGVVNLVPGADDPHRRSTSMRPFFVGAVHGLAGSAAAVLLILPLIDDPRWAVLYLIVFGVGTIVGMTAVTAAIAAPAAYAAARVGSLQRGLRLASGAVSLAFGAYLAMRIGFVDGLFTAAPDWAPR